MGHPSSIATPNAKCWLLVYQPLRAVLIYPQGSTPYWLLTRLPSLHRAGDSCFDVCGILPMAPIYYESAYEDGLALEQIGRPSEALVCFVRAVEGMLAARTTVVEGSAAYTVLALKTEAAISRAEACKQQLTQRQQPRENLQYNAIFAGNANAGGVKAQHGGGAVSVASKTTAHHKPQQSMIAHAKAPSSCRPYEPYKPSLAVRVRDAPAHYKKFGLFLVLLLLTFVVVAIVLAARSGDSGSALAANNSIGGGLFLPSLSSPFPPFFPLLSSRTHRDNMSVGYSVVWQQHGCG